MMIDEELFKSALILNLKNEMQEAVPANPSVRNCQRRACPWGGKLDNATQLGQ